MMLRSILVLAAPALLPGCGSTPPRTLTEGPTQVYVSSQIDGVRCTLANDKGTWRASTPEVVTVQRSPQPLEVVCVKKGYKETRFTVPCESPRERSKGMDTVGMAASAAMVPLGIMIAPLVPALGAYVLVDAAMLGAPAVKNQTSDDACTYFRVRAIMHRDPDAPDEE